LIAIATLGNGIVMVIPYIWLVQENYSSIVKNKDYELYFPSHESVKQAEKYANVKNHWVKSFWTILDITGNIYNKISIITTLFTYN